MKLRIMSDVHLECGKLRPPPVGADVVELNADFDPGLVVEIAPLRSETGAPSPDARRSA